jgi:ParB-like chromosome segregation protein Spo0J
MSASVTMIRVAEIDADPNRWPRIDYDTERLDEFRELYEGDGLGALPPIEVVPNPAGGYILTDGWHRLLVLTEDLKAQEVPAVVLPLPTGHDPTTFAYLRALACSAISSKPLSRAEKQHAVIALIAMYPGASDREIGRIAGVDHKTVGRLRERGISPAAQPAARAAPTPEQAAARLVRAFETIRNARGRGFTSWLRGGSQVGERFADVLYDVYGDDAATRARQFIAWLEAACEDLEQDGVQ